MARARIGVDLGGTKIEAVLFDAADALCARRRVATPRGRYDDTLAAIVGLVAEIEAAGGIAPGGASVGVGIPGTLSPASGLVKNANSTWLIGKPLDRDLAAALGRPVRLANDANCFALSEAHDGAGAGAHCVFGVILGTGVGAGIVIDGQAIAGPNGIAGEWGHNPMPWPEPGEWPGPDCYCARTGCIETFLSGPGLVADYRRAGGGDRTAKAIVAAAASERLAAAALARYQQRLAKALVSVINILDPDVIVLGGGLSNIDSHYDAVPPLWARHAFSDRLSTRLAPARHGDSSGVRGAARLWPRG